MLMRRHGPLTALSCIRDEAKHQKLKISAHMIHNRKKINKTIAINHQLKILSRFVTQDAVIDEFDVGKPDMRLLLHYVLYNEYKQCIDSKHAIKKITKLGVTNKIGMILNLSFEDLPRFAKIEVILVDSIIHCRKDIFSTKIYRTLRFDEHYQAFQIDTDSNLFLSADYDNLSNKFPTNISYTVNAKSCIVFRE